MIKKKFHVITRKMSKTIFFKQNTFKRVSFCILFSPNQLIVIWRLLWNKLIWNICKLKPINMVDPVCVTFLYQPTLCCLNWFILSATMVGYNETQMLNMKPLETKIELTSYLYFWLFYLIMTMFNSHVSILVFLFHDVLVWPHSPPVTMATIHNIMHTITPSFT